MELLTEVGGEIDDSPKVAVVNVDGWPSVLKALQPYPEALVAARHAFDGDE